MAKKSEEINFELVRKLARANQAIKLLKQELRESKEAWMIYLFKFIEEELEDYKWMIKPYPFKLEAAYKGKSVVYQINITDVICVISNGRAKAVYLKKPVENIEGDLHITDKILVNRNGLTVEKLCKEMEEGLRFYLVQVSKNAAINISHYHCGNESFELITKIPNGHEEINRIQSGKIYLDNYKLKKDYYDSVFSLHKLKSSYKLKR